MNHEIKRTIFIIIIFCAVVGTMWYFYHESKCIKEKNICYIQHGGYRSSWQEIVSCDDTRANGIRQECILYKE